MKFLLFLMLALSPASHPAVIDLHGHLDTRARGLRNNNPGNIQSAHWKRWKGAIGVDDDGYIIFRRPVDGIRAIVINLKAYRIKYGISTARAIVYRWTRGQSRESQVAYWSVVCQRYGGGNMWDPDRKINMGDPYTLLSVTRSIIYYENGVDPYPDSLYQKVFPWVGR